MHKQISLGMVAATVVATASSLAVYQDKTFYRYTPKRSFIGLTQNVQATCEGKQVATMRLLTCPSKERLCGLYNDIYKLRELLLANSANSRILSALTGVAQPRSVEADKWIAAAKKLGSAQAKLALEKEMLTEKERILDARFAKETKSKTPLALTEECSKELKLTLPYGYVAFQTQYEARLQDKTLEVIQDLSIINRSGIDIDVDRADFYAKSAQQYVRPIHFSPWIVREHKDYPMVQKRMVKMRNMPAEDMAVAAPAPVKAHYEDARAYRIDSLHLPSTGEPVKVPVMKWKAPLSCEEEVYPYRHTGVFEVCRFVPKYQIELNRWRIVKEGKVINENATGAYENGKYRLYTQADPDIKVVRKKIVQKERETGIFGGTARKKDGFTLEITNKSDKPKSLTVIERIPTSSTEKIVVKLLHISSSTKVDYKMDKEGKITMHISLAPHERRKIEVMFEISYDKDLKIDY